MVDLVDLVDYGFAMPSLLKQQEEQLKKARNIAKQIKEVQRELAALLGEGKSRPPQSSVSSGVPTEERKRIVDALEATLETARTGAAAWEALESQEGSRLQEEAGKPWEKIFEAKEFDPLEAGRKAVMQLQEAEGGALLGSDLKNIHGLSSANLHKRRVEHRIVWWRDAKNQFHYPKWQFNEAGAALPGVQEVLQIFRSSDEWRVMRYFLGPRSQLGDRTPLDLLRAGEVKKVVAHAKVHAEENTW